MGTKVISDPLPPAAAVHSHAILPQCKDPLSRRGSTRGPLGSCCGDRWLGAPEALSYSGAIIKRQVKSTCQDAIVFIFLPFPHFGMSFQCAVDTDEPSTRWVVSKNAQCVHFFQTESTEGLIPGPDVHFYLWTALEEGRFLQ